MDNSSNIDSIKNLLNKIPFYNKEQITQFIDNIIEFDEVSLINIFDSLEKVYNNYISNKEYIDSQMKQIHKEMLLHYQLEQKRVSDVLIQKAQDLENENDPDELLNF